MFHSLKSFARQNTPWLRPLWWRLKPYYWKSTKGKFDSIYQNNTWGNVESVSGEGSSLASTAAIRAGIPGLLKKYKIGSMLDIPCGDFNWMREVDLGGRHYIGADLVPDMIDKNRLFYSSPTREFQVIDLLKSDLPKADLIMCRDCLVHFSYSDINKAIRNMQKSRAKYLLTTTFVNQKHNDDIITGHWRPINLQVKPFGFPSPVEIINEQCTELNGKYPDKSLALWLLDDLR